jgi:signal transduction histidine kinase
VIRKALKDCLSQIRQVSAELAASEIESLTLAEAISTAVCLHELRTAAAVSCDFRALPVAAYPFKACLYQFVEQSLGCAFRHAAANVHVRASGGESLELEIDYTSQLLRSSSWLTEDLELDSESVRHQIEALGGTLSVSSPAHRQLRIRASFALGDMGNANV